MKRKQPAVEVTETPSGDFLHAAADRVAPLLHGAADRVGPLAQSAADRVYPLYTFAADRVTPAYTTVAGRVTPLVVTAAGVVGPYAHGAAGRVSPYAATAKQRGAQVAHGAVERLSPRLEEALDRVTPAVEGARGKVTDDLLPRLTEALEAAAAAPVLVEATKRGKATLAAAKGDLVLPEEEKKGGSWLKRLALVLALAGVIAVAVRKFLGSKDADWQAARPSAPYVPPTTSGSTSGSGEPDAVVADDSPDFSTRADGDVGAVGGAEMGLGEDVEVGEKPVPPEERDILPSDPITVLAEKRDDRADEH